MTERLIINGAPGSGKTTKLLQLVEDALERGTPPDRIGFLSFTKRAAEEARERAMKRFNLTAKQLPYFRTIHSLCFAALGINSAEMFEGAKIKECADWLGVEMSGRAVVADEGGATKGYLAGDRIVFMDNLARVRGVSIREQYSLDPDNLSWTMVERVSRGMREFKDRRGLHDFTDLLDEFIKSDFRLRLDVLIVDEAQDNSFKQWQVIEKLAEGCERVIVGGDDDQAIFIWGGADVQQFIDMPGQVEVLDRSRRVPRAVQAVALDVLQRVKHRREKQWSPRLDEDGREVEGEVHRVSDLDAIDFKGGDDVLILSRNLAHLKDDAMPLLTQQGILYEFKGYPSVKRSIVDAILNWEKLRRGEAIRVKDAEKMYEHLAIGSGVLRGHKKLPGLPDREAEVTAAVLREHGGLVADGIWHEALDKLPREDRVYMIRALKTGQKLTERPSIKMSSIHGSKGGEADHVVLLRDVAYRTARETPEQWEAEARVFYVATTRAKRRLTIVDPQTRHSYDV